MGARPVKSPSGEARIPPIHPRTHALSLLPSSRNGAKQTHTDSQGPMWGPGHGEGGCAELTLGTPDRSGCGILTMAPEDTPTLGSPEPATVTLFGKRICADVLKLRTLR